eukprot:12920152-Prorocentrum_lima.AAC.1
MYVRDVARAVADERLCPCSPSRPLAVSHLLPSLLLSPLRSHASRVDGSKESSSSSSSSSSR